VPKRQETRRAPQGILQLGSLCRGSHAIRPCCDLPEATKAVSKGVVATDVEYAKAIGAGH
jgi:hypothetical protein